MIVMMMIFAAMGMAAPESSRNDAGDQDVSSWDEYLRNRNKETDPDDDMCHDLDCNDGPGDKNL